MRTRISLIAAFAALSLLWVFALPAMGAGLENVGKAEGFMRMGRAWASECTDSGEGTPTDDSTWMGHYYNNYFEAEEAVYSLRAVVAGWDNNSKSWYPEVGSIRLCGELASSESGDDVDRATGAACDAAGAPHAHRGEGGRGQIDYGNPQVPDVQIRDLRWAPSLTGVLLATGTYETLPAGEDSSTGTFLMQLHSPLHNACWVSLRDGLMMITVFELIPAS